jgi:hypothetical protein
MQWAGKTDNNTPSKMTIKISIGNDGKSSSNSSAQKLFLYDLAEQIRKNELEM